MLDEIQWPTKIPFDPKPNMIMCGRRGSESHGLFTPSTDPDCIDDRDLIAVVLAPDRYYIGLLTDRWEGAQEINGVWDVVVFELRKYLYLVCQQNPNALLSLWLHQDDYLLTTDAWEMIYAHRHAIRSRQQAYESFRGFGRRQGYDTMGSGAYRGYMGAKRKELVRRYGFDCKAAMHWVRVLRMGAEYVRTGEMQVRRTADRDELLAIKQGKLPLDEIRLLAQDALQDLEKANKESALPEEIDMDLVRGLATSILRVHVSH